LLKVEIFCVMSDKKVSDAPTNGACGTNGAANATSGNVAKAAADGSACYTDIEVLRNFGIVSFDRLSDTSLRRHMGKTPRGIFGVR
jgi:hypothetical protein